ncbi:short-chain fatty acyl-CoA regulator family protein [Defluviimonas sp. WL0024]|uniref:Short-chain fatty acyl-CoA regulator family protein n=2 Tax=Albidovulum TaxID=205889 RepID=A0ABT3J0M2_9RHOB|nr:MULTISPECIES: short-chain fatty acyl-CoA regulator family protein [Defluviimonas]MCU9846970.1 short-chain fatty acyl-CoA regulator family protein [Defluviimonas sp. WL0024]MCW3781228.1 short-chain fatty acyl-CoA regulator family protein [Defluviimonas salinarum]
MARSALTGTRVRERRLLIGMKQADLARAVGISPAYLNLIEHNRRRVGAELLAGLADALGVEEAALAEGAESALFEGLREAAAGMAGGEATPEVARIEEFVGRFPGWAALLAAVQARIGTLERTVEALNERMAHDPFLFASLHEVVSAVTSLRSTAAILAETEEIDPAWRARFHRNVYEDSVRLSEAAAALVAYLDATKESETGLSSPQEEVEAWLAKSAYHLAALERAHPPQADTLIAGVPELASGAARKLALAHIARYRTDAVALPLDGFRRALAEVGPDPAALAQATGAGLAQVFRRLAALPEGEGPPVGLVACDASGTLTFRRPAPGFALPRHGAACPLWPLYEALARPMVPIRAAVEMAGRVPQRFLTYAFSEPRHPGGFDGPQVVEAQMLILPAPEERGGERSIGPSCRICPRGGCVARREPSILAEEG